VKYVQSEVPVSGGAGATQQPKKVSLFSGDDDEDEYGAEKQQVEAEPEEQPVQ